jgi:hypothetical protein
MKRQIIEYQRADGSGLSAVAAAGVALLAAREGASGAKTSSSSDARS